MVLPTHCGMPQLDQNIEGLRLHSMLVSAFIPEPDISAERRKWRSWLVHCLVKTARHYNEARELILAQLNEGERTAVELEKGRQFPILNFSFEMEDCITSLEKIVVCIRALETKSEIKSNCLLKLEKEKFLLNKLRNRQDHLHNQIASGETGKGPIFICLSENSDGIRFFEITLSFSALYQLVDAVYKEIANFFPKFDAASPPSRKGVPQISISATVEFRQSITKISHPDTKGNL